VASVPRISDCSWGAPCQLRAALSPCAGARDLALTGITRHACYNRDARRGPKTMKLGSVVKLLQKEHDRLTKQVKGIAAALEAFGATYGKQNGSRKISPAGRAKIAAAQRARWAKARASNGANSRTKRKMSPAAKARIAAAQRARWAKVRTATRKSAA
jgi:hypothetical protein